MTIEEIVISAFITILSIGLLTISIFSYLKRKNMKLIFVSMVFLIFLSKGLLFTINVFFTEIADLFIYFGILDVIILILLFISTIKR